MKLCTLCRCPARHMLFGFPVCTYHETHGEDEPPCPTCAQPTNPPTADERQTDASYLLGAASYLLRQFSDPERSQNLSNIIGPMAADWVAAFERYQAGARADLRYRTWAETQEEAR